MNEDEALKIEIELNNQLWKNLTEHEKYMFKRGFRAGKLALDLATVSVSVCLHNWVEATTYADVDRHFICSRCPQTKRNKR